MSKFYTECLPFDLDQSVQLTLDGTAGTIDLSSISSRFFLFEFDQSQTFP